MSCSPPVPNADVSGIGVRASFYLQYVLAVLCCSAAREARDVEDALLTLSVTNLAYCVTTMILAYKNPPELTLYDGLVVVYLTVFTLGFTFAITILYVNMRGFHYHAYIIAVVQSYFVLCTFFVVSVTLPTFGSDAECNHERRASIMFAPVPVYGFRIAGIVLSVFFILLGTGAILYHNVWRPETFGVNDYFITDSPTIDRTILIHLGMNTVTFTFCIAHVETLRLYNHPESDDQSWGFGQVLPIFLTALPAGRTLSLFVERWRRDSESASLNAHSFLGRSSFALALGPVSGTHAQHGYEDTASVVNDQESALMTASTPEQQHLSNGSPTLTAKA